MVRILRFILFLLLEVLAEVLHVTQILISIVLKRCGDGEAIHFNFGQHVEVVDVAN
jgi:hypothetical protein